MTPTQRAAQDEARAEGWGDAATPDPAVEWLRKHAGRFGRVGRHSKPIWTLPTNQSRVNNESARGPARLYLDQLYGDELSLQAMRPQDPELDRLLTRRQAGRPADIPTPIVPDPFHTGLELRPTF